MTQGLPPRCCARRVAPPSLWQNWRRRRRCAASAAARVGRTRVRHGQGTHRHAGCGRRARRRAAHLRHRERWRACVAAAGVTATGPGGRGQQARRGRRGDRRGRGRSWFRRGPRHGGRRWLPPSSRTSAAVACIICMGLAQACWGCGQRTRRGGPPASPKQAARRVVLARRHRPARLGRAAPTSALAAGRGVIVFGTRQVLSGVSGSHWRACEDVP